MDSRELSEWMAYYELEPFGEERADLRAGIVASTVANSRMRGKNDNKTYQPKDFLPKFGESKEKQTWEDHLAMVQDLQKSFGGKITTKRGA